MDRGTARTLVRQAISQPIAATSDFADAELDGFIDRSIRFLGAIVKKPVKRVSFQVTENIASYSLSTVGATDMILPANAYFGDINIAGDVDKIRIISEEELKEMRPGWLDATATTKGRPEVIFKDGSNLVINPRPNAQESATGKKVYLDYVYQPAAISSDSTELDLPIVFHDLVVKLVEYFCYDGKLNNKDKALAIKAEVEKDAKKLENLIIKESESFGFSWGSAIQPDDDVVGYVRP